MLDGDLEGGCAMLQHALVFAMARGFRRAVADLEKYIYVA
jgi:hypothetical protein